MVRSRVEQLRDGDVVDVPYLVGSNNDEMSYYTPVVNDEAELHQSLIQTLGLNFTQAIEVLSRYPYSDPELVSPEVSNARLNSTVGVLYKRANTIFTDVVFKAATRYGAKLWQQHKSSNTYIYNANTTITKGPNYFGAAHGFELAYMFYDINGTGWQGDSPPFLGGNPFEGRTQPYLDLAAVMSGMWVGFMNNGVPHYDGRKLSHCLVQDTPSPLPRLVANTKSEPVPEWPPYKGEDPMIMNFDAQTECLNTRPVKEVRAAQQDFIVSQLY